MKKFHTDIDSASTPIVLPNNMDESILDLMKQARVPGLSFAVFSKDKIEYCKGFGVKSLEEPEKVDEASLFCAASLGKPVFAYAVLRLIDRGDLDLDRPLYQYWPHPDLQHDERHQLITCRMVLEHTTGLPNWREGGRLAFIDDPGNQHTYSGEGFLYLMKIVEKVTGESMDELMRQLVFEPLDMPNSSYLWKDRFESNYAYAHNEVGQVLSRYKPMEENAAYSLQTTAHDYAQLMRALLNGTGLKKETAQVLFAPAVELARSPVDQSYIAWSLGIGLLHQDEEDYCWQWGGHNWFASLTMAMIGPGVGMVYFSNSINGFGLGKHLIQLCFGLDKTPVQWLGDYDYLSPGKKLTLELLNNHNVEKALEPYLTEDELQLKTHLLGEEEMERIGILCQEYGKLRATEKVFEVTQKAFPNSAKAAENYAYACLLNRKQNTAAQYFKLAFELDASKINCHENYLQLTGQSKGNVRFCIKGHYHARSITVAGEFNDWQQLRHPFKRERGEWVCELQLPPGKYQYKFVIDGIWTLDADNPKTVYQYQHNSLLEVA